MANVIIDVNHLEKQYMKQKAVRDVSFQIKKGMICGLIGPNGAGKTTIMKMLGGLVIPTGGSISIYGSKNETEAARARNRMSFMIETPYAKEKMTARENLEKQRIQKGIPNKQRIDEVLEIVGLQDVGKKQVGKFSLGMRQRLGIANALLCKPEIMILDEPINGLDPEGIVEIRELLKRLNEQEDITIMISSHILSELSLICTDYLFVNHGELLQSISAKELQKLCQQCYQIHTDNDSLAVAILQEQLHLNEYDVNKDGSINVYERLDDIRTISKTLFEHGVIPLELKMKEANLEKYYMDMVGGDYDVEHNESN